MRAVSLCARTRPTAPRQMTQPRVLKTSAPTDTVRKPTVRAERRALAERRLLDAAREIVAAKGCVGMTLEKVGEAAGYSRGLAAHHFGSKGGLLIALAHHLDDTFKALIHAGPPRRDGLDALEGFITTYLGRKDTQWTNTRALLLLMAESLIDDSGMGDQIAGYNARVVRYVEDHVRAGIATGEIRRDVQPNVVAALIMGALRGVMLQKLNRDSKLDLKKVSRQMVDLLVRSLADPAHPGAATAATAVAPRAPATRKPATSKPPTAAKPRTPPGTPRPARRRTPARENT